MSAATRLVAAAVLFVAIGSPQAPEAAERIAEALRAGSPGDAAELARHWAESAPSDPRPLTLMGLALAQMGRTDDSLNAYRSAISLAPDYLPALQAAAEMEWRLGRPEAAERLRRIVSLQPRNGVAHAMLGALAHSEGDCELALEHFRHGAEAVESDSLALRRRAECRFSTGSFDGAAADFRRMLESASDDGTRHNLGLALHEAGRYSEAVEALRPAKSDLDTLSLLAEAQRAALDTPGALATLQRAIKTYPRSERLYLQLAELCIEHGAYELGIEVTDAGSANIPGSFRIPTMRGILLAELGRYDDAEAAFELAAARDPAAQSAAVGLSLTLQKTGRLDESLNVLRERVDRDPGDAVARYFYAQALVKQGVEPGTVAFAEALASLQAAARELESEAAPRVELGKLYLRAGQPERAIAVLEEAARIAPRDRQTAYNLMIALRRTGRNEEAAQLAVQVRERLGEAQQEEIRRNRFRLVRTDP